MIVKDKNTIKTLTNLLATRTKCQMTIIDEEKKLQLVNSITFLKTKDYWMLHLPNNTIQIMMILKKKTQCLRVRMVQLSKTILLKKILRM